MVRMGVGGRLVFKTSEPRRTLMSRGHKGISWAPEDGSWAVEEGLRALDNARNFFKRIVMGVKRKRPVITPWERM
jgi:hypothetical protein